MAVTDEGEGAGAGGGEHTEATVQQLAALYAEHHRTATPVQRLANRVTSFLSRPSTLLCITGIMAAWMVGNTVARSLGSTALEAFPFPDLAFFATISALLVALLILTTRRHDEVLAERRAQLTLQIAVLSEQKIAKVIALIEEQRRDNPLLHDRRDAEADRLAHATDPQAQLDRLDAGFVSG